MKRFLPVLAMAFLASLLVPVYAQKSATFDKLPINSGLYWNGSDNSKQFTSGEFVFYNNYNSNWASWSGFSYSKVNDTVTNGYANQYATYANKGVHGSEKYAVAYASGACGVKTVNGLPSVVSGMFISNSTYAALTMRNGDAYSKKFGGASGNEPDWFLLTVFGYENNIRKDSVNFYLADYRFAENDSDYIVKDWEWVDFTTLGEVDSLSFKLSSSDNGQWGMNTPAYFCVDNVGGNAPSLNTFDDLTLSNDSFWNGSDLSGSFYTENLVFKNKYTASQYGDYWSGWAYSNKQDITTPGYVNQYSAWVGKQLNQSENFGISYVSSKSTISLKDSLIGGYVHSAYLANNTYAALSMKNGDAYSKKFGGVSGSDEDWLRVRIKGIGLDGNYTDSIDFYLADYRFSDNSADYIINEWTKVNLLKLGKVKRIEFSMSSSDNGQWGMNTPAYFCIDNIKVVNEENESVVSVNSNNINQLMVLSIPNPCSNSVRIETGIDQVVDLQLFDSFGKEVMKLESYQGEDIRLDGFATGLYIVKIKSGTSIAFSRFIKN